MDLDGSTRSWTVGPLELATTYFWQVEPLSGSDLGPGSALQDFYTGPVCSSGDRASYSPAVLLRPFDGEVIRSSFPIHISSGGEYLSVGFPMTWDDPTTCLPPEGYTLQWSRDPTFLHVDLWASSIYLHSGTYLWFFFTPGTEWHDCERYYWRVLTGRLDTSGAPSADPYAEIYAISETWSFLINTSGLICPLDGLRIITPFPAITLPPEGVPGPGTPMADVNQPANCRSGPGADYQVVDILAQGTSAPVIGRNQEGTWWQVSSTNLSGCWIFAPLANFLSGDVEEIPVLSPSSVLTIEPSSLPSLMDPMGTLIQPANCRSGPGMDYPVADILAQGLSLRINGRNQQGTWWQVLDSNLRLNCWLAGAVIDIRGITSDVPLIAVAPPAATDTPVPGPGAFNCAQYNKDQNACNKSPYCIWDSNGSPNSPCVNKP